VQCVAVFCSIAQRVAEYTFEIQEFASKVEFGAMCCSVLQCSAVCCSVLQCVPSKFKNVRLE